MTIPNAANTIQNSAVVADTAAQLRINEIFYSLQGEANSVGWPTVFIRLTGCPLRCHYCDTAYAFTAGDWMSIDTILDRVAEYNVQHITVTGGEPLAQPQCKTLLSHLCERQYQVSLETSGAIELAGVDSRVIKVMDIKTPGSGEDNRNRWENLACLNHHDQIKIVICDRADYEWAKTVLIQRRLNDYCDVLLSPSYQQLPPQQLADWILQDQLPVRLQIQLHKLLWGDKPGH